MSQHAKIAVLGLGIMGSAFARNLGAAGFEVRAWNRSAEPRERMHEAPGVAVTDAADVAVAGADVVILMLATAEAVRSVVEPLLPHFAPGALVVQMGTIGVEGTEELARLVGQRDDVVLVDAPVSGSKTPAEQGTLTILASGPAAVQTERSSDDPRATLLASVFDVLGGRTVWLGEAGAGTRMKLVVNAWLMFVMHGFAEAATLGQALGFAPSELWAVLEGGPLAPGYIKGKLPKIESGDDEPEMALEWAAKDLRLALEAADSLADRPSLPALDVLQREWKAAAEDGLGGRDVSAIFTRF